MHVLLHVSLEENCDLIKCISTIYEHWKIVNHGPNQSTIYCRLPQPSDVSTCYHKEGPSVRVSRNVIRPFHAHCNKFPSYGPKNRHAIAKYHSARRVWTNHQLWVCLFKCVCVYLYVFDHNETVTEILIEKKRSHKSGAVILSFIAFFYRFYRNLVWIICSAQVVA